MDQPSKKPFFTKRFIFSLIVLINGTALVYFGKLGGEQFVYLCALVVAGHHAADLITAWRGRQ